MGEQFKPQKGDRVRVVLEGEVVKTWGVTAFDVGNYEAGGGTNHIIPSQGHVVSVEKIEPPVEFFKPGDVVRNTGYPEHVYTLGKDGYYSHMAEKFHKPCGAFTSADYELIYRP